ncbi:MAG: arginine--tRNA ligase [Erysipelotrichaceae bacterium]|nr:arginine--tRNA ligase [Erysipelotrichaceae bacterium]
MNAIESNLKQAVRNAVEKAFSIEWSEEQVTIEIPKDKSHGDYATNIAMQLTRTLRTNPKMIAQQVVDHLDLAAAGIAKVEIAGPGFINFTMENDTLSSVIAKVLKEDEAYGSSSFGENQKVNVEFVSANPTGDLHPGHARGAATGDSVCRILRKAGYDVTAEYYVNDAGNQIRNMAVSLQARYLEQCGKDVVFPEDGYHGPDLIEIAKQIVAEEGMKYADTDPKESLGFFRQYGLKEELAKLKRDLAGFNVHFDVWTSEQSIYDRGLVKKALDTLIAQGNTYEAEGALWLKTTTFGDDKDRVLVKSDGSYTYLTPDIAYHLDKLDRGFDRLVNFFGADHHSYVTRLKAAIGALGYESDKLSVDIIQMARMIKDGEEFKLSKRSGKAVALRDLVEEAGADAVRYFFASRACDTQMDFDLDMATKQSNENPVYYAQYAHARMCSILRSAPSVTPQQQYSLLTHTKETALLKQINEFPNIIVEAAKSRAPHKVCNYIQRLAQMFHSFYADCKVLSEDAALTNERLALVQATRITLRNALDVIGVSAPEQM